MKITKEQLEVQTEGLIHMLNLNTPAQIGTIVIFIDHESGLLCLRAAKITKEKTAEALRLVLKGYGDQQVKEVV